MSESAVTKQALAQSLKELVKTQPLCKISIGELCAHCGMNRKSFYYHFCDKYDLILWIFETEFMARARMEEMSARAFLLALCTYFEENRCFYRRVLEVDGQNSLDEYLRKLVRPALEQLLPEIADDHERLTFYVHFHSDAFLSSLRRWLGQPSAMNAHTFVAYLCECLSHANAC